MKEKALSITPLCPFCTKIRCIGCNKREVKSFYSKHRQRFSEIFDLDDDVVMIDVTLKRGIRVILRNCEVDV